MQRHAPLITTILAAAISFLFGAEECYPQAHTKGAPVAPFTPTLKPGDYAWHPEVSPAGPVVVLVSLPDQVLYVYLDGTGRRDWISTASVGKKAPNLKNIEDRISIDPSFLRDVRALIAPGTTLVLADLPVSSQIQSGSGFKILTTDVR